MTINRVQFQRGVSIAECTDRYGSEDKCEAALIASRWPSGFVCPACGCTQSSSSAARSGCISSALRAVTSAVWSAVDAQEARISGSDDPAYLTGYLTRDLWERAELTGYLLRGLSDASPDWARRRQFAPPILRAN